MLRKLRLLLRHRSVDCLRFIHEEARTCARSKLAFPLYISKGARLKRSTVESYSYIARDTILVDTKVGRYVSIGPECLIGGLGHHPSQHFSTSPLTYSPSNPISRIIGATPPALDFEETAEVKIADDVWIGARCIITDGVSIGRGAIIGANTVVTKDIPPYAVYYGSPATIKRMRFSPEIIAKLEAEAWWHNSPKDLTYTRLRELTRFDLTGRRNTEQGK